MQDKSKRKRKINFNMKRSKEEVKNKFSICDPEKGIKILRFQNMRWMGVIDCKISESSITMLHRVKPPAG